MSTTTQMAGAGRSALAWTDHDETNGSAWPPATRRELGTLPLSRLRRVMDIREHLDQGLLSIAQISRVVGFRTPSHFSTVFRRITSATPRAYRARYLETGRPEGQ